MHKHRTSLHNSARHSKHPWQPSVPPLKDSSARYFPLQALKGLPRAIPTRAQRVPPPIPERPPTDPALPHHYPYPSAAPPPLLPDQNCVPLVRETAAFTLAETASAQFLRRKATVFSWQRWRQRYCMARSSRTLFQTEKYGGQLEGRFDFLRFGRWCQCGILSLD